ncbi:hypothetical protein [Anaeromyxobacter dehalogenans]|uniref:Uncharacterized protein n=1 Tax=Anaeromyxobacter dehalogenans (strain 2CP-C) TaxID=290397 RepID=Q2IQN3_ANADE|nr:hypothetical protein [Anaeromyxobacter dehalogenans]ABC81114.1 hypothetical protein Adeh_1340 [Anaeromyxobacter dehalogenans 2CP-C]
MLEDALAEAEAALARDDVIAAARAVRRAAAACEALAAARARLDPRALARAADAQRRALHRAEAGRARLADALDRASRSRRATAAYRRG